MELLIPYKMIYVKKEDVMRVLNELYSDPLTGFVGRDKLWEKVKLKYTGIRYVDVEQFLQQHPIAQRHRAPPKKDIVVQPIKSSQKNERWQMDLVDMGDSVQWRNHSHRCPRD